jgi:enolase
MTAIVDIIGREIRDSRGNPTGEVDVISACARRQASCRRHRFVEVTVITETVEIKLQRSR